MNSLRYTFNNIMVHSHYCDIQAVSEMFDKVRTSKRKYSEGY